MVLQLIKKISPIIILFSVSLVGCEGNNRYDYDKGYKAAWNGSDKPSWNSSKKYKEGYEQGRGDAEVYDMGYYDGYNKQKCFYPKDPDYMDGYKDGSKDKNRW